MINFKPYSDTFITAPTNEKVTDFDFVLDSAKKPHVIYFIQRLRNKGIVYKTWDGSQWIALESDDALYNDASYISSSIVLCDGLPYILSAKKSKDNHHIIDLLKIENGNIDVESKEVIGGIDGAHIWTHGISSSSEGDSDLNIVVLSGNNVYVYDKELVEVKSFIIDGVADDIRIATIDSLILFYFNASDSIKYRVYDMDSSDFLTVGWVTLSASTTLNEIVNMNAAIYSDRICFAWIDVSNDTSYLKHAIVLISGFSETTSIISERDNYEFDNLSVNHGKAVYVYESDIGDAVVEYSGQINLYNYDGAWSQQAVNLTWLNDACIVSKLKFVYSDKHYAGVIKNNVFYYAEEFSEYVGYISNIILMHSEGSSILSVASSISKTKEINDIDGHADGSVSLDYIDSVYKVKTAG